MSALVMRRCMMTLALALPGWCVAALALGDERAQLAAQRQQIESRAEQALAVCSARFDVTGCQEAARRERSAALAPLQRREAELADLERKDRSEQQQLRVRDKQRDAALLDAQQQMAPPVAPTAAASASTTTRPAARAGRPDAAAAELARQQQAQRAAERAQNQRLRSEEQRRKIEQRQADRAKSAKDADKADNASQGKPQAGLPVPSAAQLAALRASAPASSAPRP
ncbi:MAG: hypothetical protein C0423_02635 [Methylibium sp.]|nr:hypothetical protein [Methylibium sp.]